MKTKLTFLVAALALTGISYGGPSDSAAFAIRNAREAAARDQGPSVVVANTTQSTTYVPSSSGKGLVQTSSRDEVTNIALFKSSKTKAGGAACCATTAKR